MIEIAVVTLILIRTGSITFAATQLANPPITRAFNSEDLPNSVL